jgi:hypothetical protein
MSKNLSIIEKEEELIIKHKSEEKKSNFGSSIFAMIFSLAMLITLFSNGIMGFGLFLLFSPVLITSIKIASTKTKNNIKLKLDKNNITITHQSNYLGWGKTREYTFSAQNIKQVYIRKNNKKNIIWWFDTDNVSCYEIFVQKNDGEIQRILGDEEGFFVESPKEAQFIKGTIQGFLQTIPQIRNIQIRKLTKETQISKMRIKDLKKGVLLDYKLDTWEVTGQIQYDWQQGNTDTLYQLQNSKNTTILLLVCQDMAIYNTWLEIRLSYHDLAKNSLDKVRQELPLEFVFQGKIFLKEEVSSGYEFVGNNPAAQIKEWKYISEDKTSSLRILEHEDEDIFVFSGKKVENYEFSNILLS